MQPSMISVILMICIAFLIISVLPSGLRSSANHKGQETGCGPVSSCDF